MNQASSRSERSSAPRLVCVIGFMGAGKSTVGGELARRLGWKFTDLDGVIEAREGMTISRIFESQGEAAFRQIENSALSDLLTEPRTPMVVALGGGTFVPQLNRALLSQWKAKTVFLSASADELWRRCTVLHTNFRPLLQDKGSFRKLLEDRQPAYEQAHVTVNTEGKSVQDVAAEIESSLALACGQ